MRAPIVSTLDQLLSYRSSSCIGNSFSLSAIPRKSGLPASCVPLSTRREKSAPKLTTKALLSRRDFRVRKGLFSRPEQILIARATSIEHVQSTFTIWRRWIVSTRALRVYPPRTKCASARVLHRDASDNADLYVRRSNAL